MRNTPVSPVARRVGRVRVAAPVSVMPLSTARTPAVYLASTAPPIEPVAPLAAAAAATAQEKADLTRRVAESARSLEQREAEIAALRKAAQAAANALAEAHTDAKARGYKIGEKEGEQAARRELDAQIGRIKGLAGQIAKAGERILADSEDQVVEVIFTALCRIIGEQGASRCAIDGAVRETIAGLRTREQIIVRLHPDDAALLCGERHENGGAGPWRIEADTSIVLGGCIVESAIGALDARFETQLALLGAALIAARAVPAPGGERT